MFSNNKIIVVLLTAFTMSVCYQSALAEFLYLPDITETPELKRESLLLDLDIPSVRERDPDPQAGPRLNVREFRIQGLVEYPELGITRAEIIKRIEDIRFDLMDEGKRLESGYTEDELGEISDLIVDIEKQTKGEHVGPVDVQRLVFLIREQRRRRGITLGMIETVADTITAFYRERGFILAKAYIPKQRVRDGVVALTLLLGVLGEVEVNNNQRYRDKTIQSVFNDVLGRPVTNSIIEEKLFLLNDLPGLSAQGYFQPGSQVGDTKLNVNVSSEKWLDANIRLDNHGANQTGENRIYADVYWNNPTGVGDQLFIAGLYASDPGNSTYGAVRYNTYVFNPRFKFNVGVSKNDFVLGPGNDEFSASNLLDFKGESTVVDVLLTFNLQRSRTRNFSTALAYEQIESDIDVVQFPSLGESLGDEVHNTSIVFNYDVLQERQRRLHIGSIKWTRGELVEGASEGQDESFDILSVDYTLLTFWIPPFTKSETRIIARLSGQYSGASLSSISQYSLSGPTRARGFSVSEFFAADAIYAGVDWQFRTPEFLNFSIGKEKYTDVIQPFLFADYSYGINNSDLESEGDEVGEFADIGLGFKFSLFDSFRANLQFAYPLLGEISVKQNNLPTETTKLDDDSIRVYFDMQYSF